MSFFERAVANAPPPPEPEPEPASPSWLGPPEGVVPGQSSQRAVLFRTDRAVLVIGHLDAYPTGVEFSIDLRVRSSDEHLQQMPWERHWPTVMHRTEGASLPDEFLRLGFELADGWIWTNVSERYPSFDEEPTGPVVIGRGGSGGTNHWTMRYWMWPLPPSGDLVIHAAWPAFDIDEVSVTLDATEIREAAERADTIWP